MPLNAVAVSLQSARREPDLELSPDLDQAIAHAARALRAYQNQDGHFAFELEADATIPSEYVLLKHFLGEPDLEIERKIAVYLRRTQSADGGWPMLHGAPANISATVKAYLALKLIGDTPDQPHMRRAREVVLSLGGAVNCNVFTRNTLALFGIVPWRAVPVMPVEIMLLPSWFPFHLSKISYWARCTIVPMTVLAALKPVARNPRGIGIDELFVVPPAEVRVWPKGPDVVQPWGALFGGLDAVLQRTERFFPNGSRQKAIAKAIAFVRERLNGEDGLGAIYPAMANTVMMFDTLGMPVDAPEVVLARASIEKLLIVKDDEAYCQPCLSPVWDTALTAHAMLETEGVESKIAADCIAWLKPKQVLDVKGDWADQRPDVRPGGWAFQYENAHYPDLDDTAVVVMAMDRAAAKRGDRRFDESIARAREWVVGLQSRDGGWGAFDADNDKHYLNAIPFADHGALLDPPTADVTARCVSMLAQLGEQPEAGSAIRRGLDYLLKNQEQDGSWYGRWGLNYIYGTWSVLCALNAVGIPSHDPAMRRAVAWLEAVQNSDGGWGEDERSYALDYKGFRHAPSTASQTAWALLGLMAAGEADSVSVARGIDYLLRHQGSDGFWAEDIYTATGFPRVFYLRYHGYPKFFPLWAMARFRNLQASNTKSVLVGM
ncbi:squalene--hopene cyclase [Lichenihabitans psoromatis]|uniref:squalene--hopene cyclase n=1 Tax=Lichenihabitans psoromatis TaxID=2528642 RepID=UPI001035AFA5|nr:squalene--hopene cyclase [Lichenihabitans psoromatis]